MLDCYTVLLHALPYGLQLFPRSAVDSDLSVLPRDPTAEATIGTCHLKYFCSAVVTFPHCYPSFIDSFYMLFMALFSWTHFYRFHFRHLILPATPKITIGK